MAPNLTSITIEASTDTECYFLRVPLGDFLTLLNDYPDATIDRSLQKFACKYTTTSSNPAFT